LTLHATVLELSVITFVYATQKTTIFKNSDKKNTDKLHQKRMILLHYSLPVLLDFKLEKKVY